MVEVVCEEVIFLYPWACEEGLEYFQVEVVVLLLLRLQMPLGVVALEVVLRLD